MRRPRVASGLALLVLTGAASACAAPAGLALRAPSVIAVTGRGDVAVKPDTALVRLGAEARRPTLAEATADVAQRMTAVLERVRTLGVRAEDVTTVQYAIEPQIARRPEGDDPARVVGYRVANLAQIKVRDVAAAGRIVDGAIASGANVLQGVQFTLDDRKAAQATARERAVAAAQTTAAQLAKAAGVRLGRLVSLTEGGGGGPVVPVYEMSALRAGAPGPVEAGELTIVVTVEARYRIDDGEDRP